MISVLYLRLLDYCTCTSLINSGYKQEKTVIDSVDFFHLLKEVSNLAKVISKEFLSKKFVFSLRFRWFVILAFIFCILSFVILIHVLVEKCNKYWNNEVSDSEVVENEETDEQHSFVDFYTVVNCIIIISFFLFIRFSLQYHLLSPRISLLLKDSENVLECMIGIPIYYLKNPKLRHYIWKKILRRSTVQPENNQIELQSI